MLTTKRKPATVGEILRKEFMEPLGLTQGTLAAAMGVQRRQVNELCNDRRNVTVPTALILARVFGNSPDFWLNAQRRSDLWEAMDSPRQRERIKRAKPAPRVLATAGLSTTQAAVKAGLPLLAQVGRQVGALADIKGLGWEGDLDKMRRSRRSGSK